MSTHDRSTRTSDRRAFLRDLGGSLAVAGAARGPVRAAAGDRITLGFVGLGGMGIGRLRQFLKQPDVDVAALCDVDRSHLDRAAGEVEAARGRRPRVFGDFRRLIEVRELDAVVVATPDHWHALPTIAAFQAGKDVFVEKPLSYSIGEGRAMVKAARAHKRISQMGNHIHNDLPNYRRVVEIVRSGMLGRVTRVSCWKTSALKSDYGKPPDGPVPAELDYDFWLGPAPRRPYNPNRSHFRYRYFWDYSGGQFIDFWCHITDVAYWALDLRAPTSVSAIGGRFHIDDNTETPDSLDLLYEFPGLDVTWSVSPMGLPGCAHMGGIGCVFQGTEGSLAVNYERHELSLGGKRVDDFTRPAATIPDSPGHLREFLDAIRSRQVPSCDVEYGHRLTKGGLLGNIAFRTGRRIYWDDTRERIVGDGVANRLVTRRYRKPWKLG